MDAELAQSPLIPECPDRTFGLPKAVEDAVERSERQQRPFQLEAEIDSQFQRLAARGLRLDQL
jgi:hypothetical protein